MLKLAFIKCRYDLKPHAGSQQFLAGKFAGFSSDSLVEDG